MSNGIDQPLYFVECDFGRRGKAFLEMDRDRNSRREIIENIASGEYRDVVTVLECNPVERTCRDVTSDILEDAEAERWHERQTPDRQANAFDRAQDHRKNWVGA